MELAELETEVHGLEIEYFVVDIGTFRWADGMATLEMGLVGWDTVLFRSAVDPIVVDIESLRSAVGLGGVEIECFGWAVGPVAQNIEKVRCAVDRSSLDMRVFGPAVDHVRWAVGLAAWDIDRF